MTIANLGDMIEGKSDPDDTEDGPAGLDEVIAETEAGQEGEESSADAEESEESDEADEGDNPEAVDEPTEDSGESDDTEKSDPGAEAGSELEQLKQKLERLEQEREFLFQHYQRSQQPPQPGPREAGPDPREIREVQSALKALWTEAPDKAGEALAKFAPRTRDAVLEANRRHTELLALQATDPASYVRSVILPELEPLLAEVLRPVQETRQELAFREFSARHSDLFAEKATVDRLKRLVVESRVPPEEAAAFLRQQIALEKANKKVAKVDQVARDQRALAASRRAQAGRKPDAKAKPKLKLTGKEQGLHDLWAAEQRLKNQAASEE